MGDGDNEERKRWSIAMVSDFFHPNVGGVENHIYMLSVELMRRGHKVIVITHSHPPDRVGIRWLLPGIKVYHIPFRTIASSATLPNFFTFLPYLRTIVLRERIDLIHTHASLSSLSHEAILHAHLFGMDFSWKWWGKRKLEAEERERRIAPRTVFTDHSLFGFDNAAAILTNKLLACTLVHVDAAICVSHTGRENTVLRACIPPSIVHVIPNAIIVDQFKPRTPPIQDTSTITVVVISRLAYRKGVDLLVAAAPRICRTFPEVRFVIGGDGPKLIDLLQMREKYLLQDRIILRGPIKHRDVRDVLVEGSIFLNTSLTESFGIAILEAACAGLYVVSTRVGGVPEVLPEDMISFAYPDEDDVFRAMSEAIQRVKAGMHDPLKAHNRIREFYSWQQVAERTERVYDFANEREESDLWTRIVRTYRLGPFAGPIYVVILIVDIFFFMVLEWMIPRDNIHYVERDWTMERFRKFAERQSRSSVDGSDDSEK